MEGLKPIIKPAFSQHPTMGSVKARSQALPTVAGHPDRGIAVPAFSELLPVSALFLAI